jgi:hypothetical protein
MAANRLTLRISGNSIVSYQISAGEASGGGAWTGAVPGVDEVAIREEFAPQPSSAITHIQHTHKLKTQADPGQRSGKPFLLMTCGIVYL